MELFSILVILLGALLFLKVLSIVFNTGIFILMLPIKILAVLLSVFVVLLIALPLGIIGAVAGLLAVPLMAFFILLPVIMIFVGIFFLLKRS